MPFWHSAPLASSIPVLLVVWWGFFLFFYSFFFCLLHSEQQNTSQCCQEGWSRQPLVLFFQLKGIIIVTNSFILCISFMLTPPNEQRYLIYSLLSVFEVIDDNSCSGSDIQPVSHTHPLWCFPRRISAFLHVFEENLPLIFTKKYWATILCTISCAPICNQSVRAD